ncbi:MAG: M15 family metallopeptidase [Candidatus Limnocylindrales bacterium]
MNCLRPLCLAFALALGTLFGALGMSHQVVRAAPLPPPECRYEDVLTLHSGVKEWRISLLDPIYMVPRDYVPPKLVSVSNAGIQGSGKVRRVMIDDLAAMAAAARTADAPLRVTSAYRRWSEQKYLYQREIELYGLKVARESVARPGHSEHQLGTAIDFSSGDSTKKAWAYDDWAKTAAGAWLMANGWRYGFLLSYPYRKKNVTCYRYEPWHWRYVGQEMAAEVHASGLTLREYLWKHHH